MADFDAAFVQQVFDVAQRKCEANVQHYRQADDLWARFEVFERRRFGHPPRLGVACLDLKLISSDSAIMNHTLRKVSCILDELIENRNDEEVKSRVLTFCHESLKYFIGNRNIRIDFSNLNSFIEKFITQVEDVENGYLIVSFLTTLSMANDSEADIYDLEECLSGQAEYLLMSGFSEEEILSLYNALL